MQLLDAGCGSGAITIGLARRTAPGRLVGIDLEPGQVARARALAAQRQATNVRFAAADLYRLPFPDGSFDAAFAHNVLEHLADPLAAMLEIRRVLRPGGVVGVRDPDFGTAVLSPPIPLVERAGRLLVRLRALGGGRPRDARHHRRLLLRAGFVRCAGFAFAECQGGVAETRAFAAVFAEVLGRPDTIAAAVARGWAEPATLGAMPAAIRAWGERPDAFRALLDCAAVGWKPDAR